MISTEKKWLLSLTGAACFTFGLAQTSQAAVLNGGFDSGFSGWQTTGATSIVNQGGNNLAQMTAGGNIDSTSLEGFLGLASGQLNGLGNGTVFGGSAIKQSFLAQAGETVSFSWQFIAGDYLPFNDFAFTSLSSALSELADVDLVGNYGDSGLQSFSWTIPTTGIYTLGFGVVNVNDNALGGTQLLVDNVGGGVTPVPTPALLPGLVGLGMAALRKRKENIGQEAVETAEV